MTNKNDYRTHRRQELRDVVVVVGVVVVVMCSFVVVLAVVFWLHVVREGCDSYTIVSKT